MKQKIHEIPDTLLSEYITLTFAGKYGQISSDRTFYTNASSTNYSSGFEVFNEVSFKLQSPYSVYVAELLAIHYALELIASLPSVQYFFFRDSLSSIEAICSKNTIYFEGSTESHHQLCLGLFSLLDSGQ